ncbi:hypothetical protein KAT51_05410 [bacterium]|nr:hypothetical protein [bacterium]
MRITERTIILLVILLIVIAFATRCPAAEISLGYGQDVPITSWQSEGLECSVFQLEISQDVNSWLYGSLIFNRLEGKLNSPQTVDGKHFSGSVVGLASSSRVGLQKILAGQWSIRLFGGFGILPQVLPEIGNSGVVGHFGAKIAYKFFSDSWNIGYEICHMSDPLQHGDKGWNWQMLTLGWRF